MTPTVDIPTTFRGVEQFEAYQVPAGGKATVLSTYYGTIKTMPEPSDNLHAASAFYQSWSDEWGDDEDYA